MPITFSSIEEARKQGKNLDGTPKNPAATPPPAPMVTPQPVQQPAPAPEQNNPLVSALMSKGYSQADAINAANGPRAAELTKEYGVTTGTSNPNDFSSIYKGLYESSGITALEKEHEEKQKRANEAKASNNENPFYSEATRVGRIR